MKNSTVGLKELRENLETYISRVKKGKSFIVMRRSEPVFKISPPDEDEGVWETIADFTTIEKDGISAREILKTLRKMNA